MWAKWPGNLPIIFSVIRLSEFKAAVLAGLRPALLCVAWSSVAIGLVDLMFWLSLCLIMPCD